MIYLIKTVFHDVENNCALPLLKIGYAKNVKNRMETYKTCNPLVEKLNEREGDYELESYLHKYFSKFLYPSCCEWFYYDQSIVDNFDKINMSDDKEYILGKWKKGIINELSSIPELIRRVINDKDVQKEVEKEMLSEGQVEKLKWNIRGYLGRTRQNLLTEINSIVVEDIDKESPFENNITTFYKIIEEYNADNKTEFDNIQSHRKEMTNVLLSIYDNATGIEREALLLKYKNDIISSKYANDFLVISKITGNPEYSNLIEIIYKKSWEINQKDFQDSINTLKSQISKK